MEEPCSGIQPTHGQSGFLPNPHLLLVGPRSSSIIGSPKKHMLCQDRKLTPQAPDQRHMHIQLRSFPRQRLKLLIQSFLHAAATVRRAFPPRLPWLAISLTKRGAGRFLRFSEPAGLEDKDICEHCIYDEGKKNMTYVRMHASSTFGVCSSPACRLISTGRRLNGGCLVLASHIALPKYQWRFTIPT